jgi:hypothetical protein
MEKTNKIKPELWQRNDPAAHVTTPPARQIHHRRIQANRHDSPSSVAEAVTPCQSNEETCGADFAARSPSNQEVTVDGWSYLTFGKVDTLRD